MAELAELATGMGSAGPWRRTMSVMRITKNSDRPARRMLSARRDLDIDHPGRTLGNDGTRARANAKDVAARRPMWARCARSVADPGVGWTRDAVPASARNAAC